MPTVTYQTSPRTGITAADPDASKLPVIRCAGAVGVSLGGMCNVPNSSITFNLIQLDATGTVNQGVSGPYVMSSGLTANWGTQFLGVLQDNNEAVWHLFSPQFVIQVVSITPAPTGTPPVGPVWEIGWGLAFPPGVTPPQP